MKNDKWEQFLQTRVDDEVTQYFIPITLGDLETYDIPVSGALIGFRDSEYDKEILTDFGYSRISIEIQESNGPNN